MGEGVLLARAGRLPGGGREAVDALLSDAAAGSVTAIGALEEVGRWLGTGLAGLVNVFGPELVVLGGRLERIYPFVITACAPSFLSDGPSRSPASWSPRARNARPNAALLGAAELAFEPLLADPAAALPGGAMRIGRPQRESHDYPHCRPRRCRVRPCR